MNDSRSTQSGMSLIGVVIAAGAASFIMLVLADSVYRQAATVSYLEDRLTKVSLETVLRSSLSDSVACENTFAGNSYSSEIEVDILRDRDGTNILPSNTFDKLNVTSLTLENLNMTGVAGETGMMNLTVQVQRTREGGGPQDLRPISIPLTVTTDSATNNIVTCGTSGSLPSAGRSCTYSRPTMFGRGPASTRTAEEGQTYSVTTRGRNGWGSSLTINYVCINGNNVVLSRVDVSAR